jgi:hypothetical protein
MIAEYNNINSISTEAITAGRRRRRQVGSRAAAPRLRQAIITVAQSQILGC